MRASLLLLTTVLLTTALLLAGSAHAQQWAGVRSGYPLGVTVHYGTPLDAFDLRVSGRVVADGGNVRVGVGLDALTAFAAEGPLTAYYGAGPALDIGGDDLVLDVHALLGGELRFSDVRLDRLGLFLEGTVGGRISLGGVSANTRLPAIGAALGVNWHF